MHESVAVAIPCLFQIATRQNNAYYINPGGKRQTRTIEVNGCRTGNLSVRPVQMNGTLLLMRRHLHRQRERFIARDDTDSEIRARRGLEYVPDHAAI